MGSQKDVEPCKVLVQVSETRKGFKQKSEEVREQLVRKLLQ